jgi:hypothetical protein
MIKTVKTHPSHGIFFISDESLPDAPISGERMEFLSNGRCILGPCQHDQDGPLEITIGDYADVPKDGAFVFSGPIETPNRLLVCSNVVLEHMVAVDVKSTRTKVSIWTDGQRMPEWVVIGLEPVD